MKRHLLLIAVVSAAASASTFLINRAVSRTKAVSFSSERWGTRTIGDLTLEAPFGFKSTTEPYDQLPRSAKDAIQTLETVMADFPSGSFAMFVGDATYKPDVEVSLDGALNGAVTNAAASLGDQSPKVESKEILVDGLPARRATYRCEEGNQTGQLEGLFVQREQRLWQVIIMFNSNENLKDARRILESVRIKK